MNGPKMTDQAFFDALDRQNGGLAHVFAAADAKDYAEARRLFAAHIRLSLRPERFFTIPYEFGENAFVHPGESEKEAAERILRHELISCATPHQFGEVVDWFHNPTFNQYREWTWQLSRHHEFKLLAHQYRETGDERYAQCFAELFTSWVRQAVVPGPVGGGETLCWRTIEAGIRMGADWPYTLHCFFRSQHFTDDVLIDWYKSVWEHGWRLYGFSTSANWLIMEMNGLAQIGILYPEFAASRTWLDYAVGVLERELPLQIYRDSFHYELSTGYHEVLINNYVRLMQVAEAYNVPMPGSFTQEIEDACALYPKLIMPNGCLPDLNDGTWKNASIPLAPRVSRFPHREDFRWIVSHGKEGAPPPFTSIALPFSGFMVMRTGWEPNAVWGLLDAAPFGRGHQHEDKLSLLVFGRGKLLVSEGGNYAYDASEMRRYVTSTRAHNTVRVDGLDQNRRCRYAWAKTDILLDSGMEYRVGASSDFARGVYDEGYGPDAGISVRHTRSVHFLKDALENQTFFVVIDQLEPPDGAEHEYEWLWHLGEDSVALDGDAAVSPDVTILSATSVPALQADVCGQETPWQGWMPRRGGRQGDFSPIHVVRRTARGSSVSAATVLFPCAAGKCPVKSVALTGSRAVLMLKSGGFLAVGEP